MQLNDHTLKQLDTDYLEQLPYGSLCTLSKKLLIDLQEARDRLNQDSTNTSKPPSSDSFDKSSKADNSNDHEGNEPEDENITPPGEDLINNPDNTKPSPDNKPSVPEKKKPGKQPGAPGFGRQQSLSINNTIPRKATACLGCGHLFTDDDHHVAYTGYDTVEMIVGNDIQPGIVLSATRQVFYDSYCGCGHVTREEPYRNATIPFCEDAIQTEWRLVGPMLSSFIVCLSLRNRLSRARIQEFLWDWFGLHLSIGTINQTIHEAADAVSPSEKEILQEIINSKLLLVDETSWKQWGLLLWLWVFVTPRAVLYAMGRRTKAMLESMIGEQFQGILMSDGYSAYRFYQTRLRCWAHLLRKARGLEQSMNHKARTFGKEVLALMNELMQAIYTARASPGSDLVLQYQEKLEIFKKTCQKYNLCSHDKTRALAGEFINDWEAIFRILSNPSWPLTNNEAEQQLRHWVILRKISHGTRTSQGSRAFTLLASVIDTCRRRNVVPWKYISQAIAASRSGIKIPSLPVGV